MRTKINEKKPGAFRKWSIMASAILLASLVTTAALKMIQATIDYDAKIASTNQE